MYHQLDYASYMFFSVKQKILFDLYNFNAFYKLFKCLIFASQILTLLRDISKLITFKWLNEFLSCYCSVIAWVKSYILVYIVWSNIAKKNIDAPVCASDYTNIATTWEKRKRCSGREKDLTVRSQFLFLYFMQLCKYERKSHISLVHVFSTFIE